MKQPLRYAVMGAVIFGAVGLLITWVPQYYLAGRDITWAVGTTELAAIGAALGVCFGWLIGRLARCVK